MQASTGSLSAWQQLKKRDINCEEAIELLVDNQGSVNLQLLDREVTYRFFKQLSDRQSLPPVIPLLLWRNCYYLGSPVTLSEAAIVACVSKPG